MTRIRTELLTFLFLENGAILSYPIMFLSIFWNRTMNKKVGLDTEDIVQLPILLYPNQ